MMSNRVVEKDVVGEAVRIKLAYNRAVLKTHKLSEALGRLRAKFTTEQYNEYVKRMAIRG